MAAACWLPSLSRALSLPPLVYLGTTSYSFYLLHTLTLAFAWSMPETLTGLLAEFPVVPQGCLTVAPTAMRLRVTTDVEFIASPRHLAWIRTFCADLTKALS